MTDHISAQKFRDTFRYYSGEPQQVAGVDELYMAIMATSPGLLLENASWLANYRKSPPEGVATGKNEQLGLARLTPSSPFSHRITPHVTYGEICLNDPARRFKAQASCDMATELAEFMEQARAAFPGTTIVVTSGHRPPAINAAVGGASNSEHLYNAGEGAVDFYLQGVSTYTLQDWVDKHWPYSVGFGANRGFVHCGIRAGRPKCRWNY